MPNPLKNSFEVIKGPFDVTNWGNRQKTYAQVEQLDFAAPEGALDVARVNTSERWAQGGHSGGHAPGNAEWCGTDSYTETEQLAQEGWPDGLAAAEKIRAELVGVMGSRSMRPALHRSAAGFAPCVPSAIAGDPDSMFSLRSEMKATAGKVVHIVYNVCVSSGIDAETLILRGAVCLALVDVLENCGFRCQVTLASGSAIGSGSDRLINIFVGLKNPDQPLTIDTLTFWLANPSSYRRVIFAQWVNVWDHDMPPGFGMPAGIIPERQGDIYLAEAHLSQVNNETAVPFLKKTLKKFGIEFENETQG